MSNYRDAHAAGNDCPSRIELVDPLETVMADDIFDCGFDLGGEG